MSQDTIVALVFVGIGMLLFLIMGGIAAVQFWRVANSRDWQPATGQVFSSRVVSRRSSDNDSNTYSPEVAYTYSVMGQQYRSNQIFVGSPVGGWGARKTVNRYPAGSTVQVYFDPQHPEQAVLERRSPLGIFMLIFALGMGGAFCGVGLASAFLPK
jgi:hypothetical protein